MAEHVIRAGDTLTKIARKFGVPLHLLIEVNQIADPNKIKIGTVLRVPAMTTDLTDLEPPPPKPATPASTAGTAINRTKFRLPKSQFVDEETQKDLVVLHFTAGSTASGAFSSWMNDAARIATAYILDVDGTIYEVFEPRFWAHHLGIKGAANANFKHDRRSIGIEIVNVGPLKLKGANLCWWPPQERYETKWCTPAETDRYVKTSYRGFDHYAAYTEAQLQALGPLVQHLCSTFNIPARIPPASKREESDPSNFFNTFTGVASHQNFRSDKFDVGPAFDWSRLGL